MGACPILCVYGEQIKTSSTLQESCILLNLQGSDVSPPKPTFQGWGNSTSSSCLSRLL